MKKELQEILALLKTGKSQREDFSSYERLKLLLKLIIILFISYLFIIGFIKLFNYYGFDLPKPDRFDKMHSWSAIHLLFAGAILAPIFEELTFRLPLIYSKINFSIFVGFIAYIISRLIFDFEYEKSISYVVGLLFGGLLYFNFTEKAFKIIKLFWRKHPLLIFYFLGLSFSFLHLSNYSEITTKIVFLSPVLLLTKFTATTIFSYARLKSGIGSSIALHMLNNGIAIFLYLLSR